MRVLNFSEIGIIAGGADPEVSTQTGVNTYVVRNRDTVTTITCDVPQSAGFHFSISSFGKLLGFDVGGNMTTDVKCTTITIDSKNQKEVVCRTGEKCEIIDLKNGQRSEVPAANDDSGLAQLAGAEGEDIASLENGGASDGLGTNGGFEGGGGGGGHGREDGDEGLPQEEADTGMA